MKRKISVNVRFAEPKDLDFCVESDYDHVGKFVLKRKVEEEAVILAEVDRKLVGYLRMGIPLAEHALFECHWCQRRVSEKRYRNCYD